MSHPLHDPLLALSDPTRVRLLCAVADQELGVGELGKVLQLPQSTVSRHLKVLLEGGWVGRRKEGTSSLFWFAEGVDGDARALWEVVSRRLQADGVYSEDRRRLLAVVAARADSRTFFAGHAGDWDDVRQQLFGGEFLAPTLLALLPPGQVVADLGCGTGAAVAALASAVERVIGVDREPAMLEVARQRTLGFENVSLREGDLSALPIEDGAVNAAMCMLVLHHIDDASAVIAESARVLCDGGRLVLLDMVSHKRDVYRREMGHAHLGFERDVIEGWMTEAGLNLRAWHVLPAAAEAEGPPLFVAVGEKPSSRKSDGWDVWRAGAW